VSNALLVLASTLLCYVAMEYAMFRVALPYLPVDVRPHLPDTVDVLAQTSKAGYLPHDYVALLGDSYAEGLGDWLLDVGGDRTKPHHTADVIRQATGRDVVSFGKGGAGSAEGIVLRPARVFPSYHCSVFPAFEVPRQMFVYFYEGNDIEDNAYFLTKVEGRYHSMDGAAVDGYLAEEYAASSPWHCHWQLADFMFTMASFAFRYHVLGLPVDNCGTEAPRANRLAVGERTVEAPALQGPALLDEDERPIRAGMDVLAHSLTWLRRRFPGVPVELVYVPAALSIYRLEGDSVAYCIGSNVVRTAPTALVGRNHDLMRDLARDIAAAQGIPFTDATPALRAAASANLVHGPRDWDHLNEIGYRTLGSLIATHVR